MLTLGCIWAEEHRHVHGKQPVRWESCHPHPQCWGPSSWPPSRGPSIHRSLPCGTETSLKWTEKKSLTFLHFFPPGLPVDAQTTDTTAHQSKQCDLWASTAQSHKTKAKSSSVLSAAHISSNTITARDHFRSQQCYMYNSEAYSAISLYISNCLFGYI